MKLKGELLNYRLEGSELWLSFKDQEGRLTSLCVGKEIRRLEENLKKIDEDIIATKLREIEPPREFPADTRFAEILQLLEPRRNTVEFLGRARSGCLEKLEMFRSLLDTERAGERIDGFFSGPTRKRKRSQNPRKIQVSAVYTKYSEFFMNRVLAITKTLGSRHGATQLAADETCSEIKKAEGIVIKPRSLVEAMNRRLERKPVEKRMTH